MREAAAELRRGGAAPSRAPPALVRGGAGPMHPGRQVEPGGPLGTIMRRAEQDASRAQGPAHQFYHERVIVT